MSAPTILIAEDDRFLRRAAEMELRRLGFIVVCAADGVEAIARARESRPDLILLDLLMPRLSGIEALRVLRAAPDTCHLRVLILSNSSRELERIEAESLGVEDYWIKSNLSLAELGERVSSLLEYRP